MPVSPVKMADAIRVLSMDAVHRAKSGHQGMPMGMADVATVLWTKFLKFDASRPDWADRDRFVLSAGHGSMLLYALLHLTGYKAVTMDQIRDFRQWGSKTPGHPEFGHTPGVETTTGPLGQGLATAVGMASSLSPPANSQAARQRIGRSRLPPLDTRDSATCRISGTSEASLSRMTCSTASRSAWIRVRNASIGARRRA